MSSANDTQIGGDHYRELKYQHWDWVRDAEIDYFRGQITKYVIRWRRKNGIQDLEKATHYIHKLCEVYENPPYDDSVFFNLHLSDGARATRMLHTERLLSQNNVGAWERLVVLAVLSAETLAALRILRAAIDATISSLKLAPLAHLERLP